jgi:predicted DNA-binding transcriptional regulator YafY
MARLMVGFGCDILIVQPDELRDAFLDLASSIQRMALGDHAAALP